MSRKETTEFLSNLLISTRLSGMGKHYASEVTLDMGTNHPKRVDFMQFCPKGGTYAGDIEKGMRYTQVAKNEDGELVPINDYVQFKSGKIYSTEELAQFIED